MILILNCRLSQNGFIQSCRHLITFIRSIRPYFIIELLHNQLIVAIRKHLTRWYKANNARRVICVPKQGVNQFFTNVVSQVENHRVPRNAVINCRDTVLGTGCFRPYKCYFSPLTLWIRLRFGPINCDILPKRIPERIAKGTRSPPSLMRPHNCATVLNGPKMVIISVLLERQNIQRESTTSETTQARW